MFFVWQPYKVIVMYSQEKLTYFNGRAQLLMAVIRAVYVTGRILW